MSLLAARETGKVQMLRQHETNKPAHCAVDKVAVDNGLFTHKERTHLARVRGLAGSRCGVNRESRQGPGRGSLSQKAVGK